MAGGPVAASLYIDFQIFTRKAGVAAFTLTPGLAMMKPCPAAAIAAAVAGIIHTTREFIMSVSSVSSGNSSFYNTVVQPIKNVAKEVGDDIGDAYDTTVDAVKSAATTVGDDISAGFKKIGNIIDTSV
ncbi:hypothetical protein [Herbaspirillum chlorophenolicum]|nr:hypothetical protein [Herbaspirillum chlorophenolicum]